MRIVRRVGKRRPIPSGPCLPIEAREVFVKPATGVIFLQFHTVDEAELPAETFIAELSPKQALELMLRIQKAVLQCLDWQNAAPPDDVIYPV